WSPTCRKVKQQLRVCGAFQTQELVPSLFASGLELEGVHVEGVCVDVVHVSRDHPECSALVREGVNARRVLLAPCAAGEGSQECGGEKKQ
ncbi:hypothetical protein OFN64_32105, partial [Escherichia coli]|nr:hypothetical protein [Escherichia coli]